MLWGVFMYVIVGLGNPGKKYNYTRHNVGFDVIDYLSKTHDIKVNKIKHKAIVGEGVICGEKVILVKPQTYMNLSGESVEKLVYYYNLEMDKLVIVYDDIDTDLGRIRIRKKGSAGTHNGMKNIIYLLNNDEFVRVRVGIGKPNGSQPLSDFVTSKFRKDELNLISESIVNAGKAVEEMLENGIEISMNKFNGLQGGQ